MQTVAELLHWFYPKHFSFRKRCLLLSVTWYRKSLQSGRAQNILWRGKAQRRTSMLFCCTWQHLGNPVSLWRLLGDSFRSFRRRLPTHRRSAKTYPRWQSWNRLSIWIHAVFYIGNTVGIHHVLHSGQWGKCHKQTPQPRWHRREARSIGYAGTPAYRTTSGTSDNDLH